MYYVARDVAACSPPPPSPPSPSPSLPSWLHGPFLAPSSPLSSSSLQSPNARLRWNTQHFLLVLPPACSLSIVSSVHFTPFFFLRGISRNVRISGGGCMRDILEADGHQIHAAFIQTQHYLLRCHRFFSALAAVVDSSTARTHAADSTRRSLCSRLTSSFLNIRQGFQF